jgi:hypothetical protein
MWGRRQERRLGRLWVLGTLLASICLSAHATHAGDAFTGIAAGGLEVSNTREIGVQRQILIINPGIITSEYVLRNRSKQPVDAVMSFQAPPYFVGQAFDPKGATDLGPVPRLNYFDFSAQVGHEIVRLSHIGRAYLATRFYWEQKFKPGETLKAKFEYHPINANGIFSLDDLDKEQYCVSDWTRNRVTELAAEKTQSGRPLFYQALTYKLKNPTQGQGPIADFNLKIVPGPDTQVVSNCQYPLRYIDRNTLGFASKDFTPSGDIDLLFIY